MAFLKSKNVRTLKSLLTATGGVEAIFTNEHSQFSFPNTTYVVDVYTTGTVNSQGQPDANMDAIVEAHIISSNAATVEPATFQTEVKMDMRPS